MTMKSQIRFEESVMGYGVTPVVSITDMSLEVGSIYCVFGRNGCGKTTILKSISGIIPMIEGRVLINEMDFHQINAKELSKKLSIVLTGRPAVSNMRVDEFVSFGRYPHNDWMGRMSEEDKEMVSRSMEICQVNENRNRLLDELSDGEMQKVQISRAMAQNTSIMLLDEPAAHLDLVNKAEIFNLLKNIAKTGEKCIVFTSHDIQFALQLADQFIAIEDGSAKSWSSDEFKNERIYERLLKSDLLEIDGHSNTVKFKLR